MKILLALLLVLALDASAQLTPRVEIQVSASKAKDVSDSLTDWKKADDKLKPEKDAKNDKAGTSQTDISGTVFFNAITFHGSKTAAQDAKQFIATNAFPKGSVVRFNFHLCPFTNDPPANWLGCKLDPRAEHSETVLKP